MTLEDAVRILDREKHNDHRWIIETTWDGTVRYAECSGDNSFEDRSEFEAVAIAEAYEKAARESDGAHLRRPLD